MITSIDGGSPAGSDGVARRAWHAAVQHLTTGGNGSAASHWGALRSQLEHRTYQPGDVLIAQGTLEPDFHIILDGVVSISALGPGGLRRELGALGPGEPIGEMSLLTGEPASADVIASTAVTTSAVSQQRLATLVDSRDRLFEALAGLLAARLKRANARLLAQYPARTHAICVRPADLPALSRLPARVAEVVAAPVLAVLVGDEIAQGVPAGAIETTNVSVVRLSAPDPSAVAALLDRAAPEYNRVLVFGPAPTLNASGAGFTSVLEVVREGGGPSPAGPPGQLVVLTSRPWTLPTLRRLSAACGRPVAAVLPPDPLAPAPGDPVARLARVLTGRQVGLALGAGAAKGLAHIGVLRAFEELGVSIDMISGSSIGSAIAAGRAAGYSIDELSRVASRIASRAVRPTLPLHSFLSNRGIRAELERIGRDRRFEDLEIPLAICATDLYRRAAVTFTSGAVWPCILASMAIPGIYPPVRAAGSYLVDGAVLNPVPSRQCRDLGAGVVVGIRLTGKNTWPGREDPSSPSRPLATETIMRSIEILHNRLSEMSRDDADVTIEVGLDRGGLRDFDRADEIVEAGYDAVMAARPELAAAMPYIAEPTSATP